MGERREKRNDEKVNIIGDSEVIKGEADPRGAHPDPYLFIWHFDVALILILIIALKI